MNVAFKYTTGFTGNGVGQWTVKNCSEVINDNIYTIIINDIQIVHLVLQVY